jgi:hypothetical protein
MSENVNIQQVGREARMYRGAAHLDTTVWVKDPVLIGDDGFTGEYSADPHDYFKLGLYEKLKCVALVCTVVVGQWSRRVMLKFEPTLHDLINWRELALGKIDESLDDMFNTCSVERFARGFDKLEEVQE